MIEKGKMLQQAKMIAEKAHEGQVDKAGRPYINHCQFVSEHAKTFEGKVAGYLHDVMEDTDYPPEMLHDTFGDDIFGALLLLNHKKSEPYMDYVRRLKANPIAVDVKLSDLSHNMDLSRIDHPTAKDFERMDKYRKALAILTSETE